MADEVIEGTHFPSEETLRRIATATEVIAGLSPSVSEMGYADMQRLVRAKKAAANIAVGDQVLVAASGNGFDGVYRLDVLHHFDGSDDNHPLLEFADGHKGPGMMLGWHSAIPYAICFEPKEAFLCAQANLAAGTYHFTVAVTTKWGTGFAAEVGSKTYQFTLPQPLAKGGQLVWNASYSAKLTSATAYNGVTDQAARFTVAISEGSGGTDLGTMSENKSSAGLNNIQRSCEGSNRWKTSHLRAVLNAEGAVSQGGSQFARPWPFAGKPGLIQTLDPAFVSVLANVKTRQEAHPFDGGAVEEVYDRVFPLSEREHYFNNYLSQTDSGYKAEGVPLDYWKAYAAANGRTGVWGGWGTYTELKVYDTAQTATSRGVWLRSARRYVSNAGFAGCVHASGTVDGTGASYGSFAAPACVIG